MWGRAGFPQGQEQWLIRYFECVPTVLVCRWMLQPPKTHWTIFLTKIYIQASCSIGQLATRKNDYSCKQNGVHTTPSDGGGESHSNWFGSILGLKEAFEKHYTVLRPLLVYCDQVLTSAVLLGRLVKS